MLGGPRLPCPPRHTDLDTSGPTSDMRCDNDRNNRTRAPTTGRALTNGCRIKTGASMALALLLAALVVPESQAGAGHRMPLAAQLAAGAWAHAA